MITIRDLSFSYNNGNKVLKNISLKIGKGEFFGILGPNGSGKTTLLKCINRALYVPGNTVLVDGKDVLLMKRREIAQKIAVVPQEVHYGFDFKVEEVVSMGRYAHMGRFEFERSSHRKVVDRAMKYTDIWDLRNKAITALSGGEKQRVVIAQAFAQEPSILLLDEPTKNLDIGHTLDVLDLIRKRNLEESLTVVAVLHDLSLASRYCHRIALLDRGRVVDRGPSKKVLCAGNIARVFGVRAEVDERGGLRVLGRAKSVK